MILGGVMIVVGATLLIGLRGGTTRLPGCSFSVLLVVIVFVPACECLCTGLETEFVIVVVVFEPHAAALGRMAGLLSTCKAAEAELAVTVDVIMLLAAAEVEEAAVAVGLTKTASDDDL